MSTYATVPEVGEQSSKPSTLGFKKVMAGALFTAFLLGSLAAVVVGGSASPVYELSCPIGITVIASASGPRSGPTGATNYTLGSLSSVSNVLRANIVMCTLIGTWNRPHSDTAEHFGKYAPAHDKTG